MATGNKSLLQSVWHGITCLAVTDQQSQQSTGNGRHDLSPQSSPWSSLGIARMRVVIVIGTGSIFAIIKLRN